MRLRARLGFTVVAVLLVFAVTAFAAAWLRRAADQEHAQAQYTLGLIYYNLGLIYLKGYGVAQDPRQAAVWYRRAADQGHVDAQYNLGLMYYKGYGVVKDGKEAAAWFRRAAD